MIWTFPQNGAPIAPYPVFRLGPYWACETPDGTLALLGKLPWGQLPAFHELPPKRVHYTAYRGWDADLWYDGPEFIWDGSAVTACVLPGTDAELPARFQRDGFADWLKKQEVLAWKKSLAKGFRERFLLTNAAYILQDLETHSTHVLALLGLRLAFPNTMFYVLDYPSYLKPQWKRYCQNLNLSTWAAPAQLQGLSALNIDDFGCVWPEAATVEFLSKLNTRIPVVPGKLEILFSFP